MEVIKTSPIIEVNNVTVEFDGIKALEKISFELNEGEILGVVGVSGSGKSILLNVLRGSQVPTAGEVIYNISHCDNCGWLGVPSRAGEECPCCSSKLKLKAVNFWKEPKERRLIRDRTAIMLQRSFALYGEETVIENLMKSFDEGNFEGNKVKASVKLLEKVNLSHRMFHLAGDLSGGEKQRVVLVRQIAKNPLILFADEPTGTLDEETATMVDNQLLEFKNEGNTLVVTSHWTETIRKLADRAIFLEDGKVKKAGDTGEIVDEFLELVGAIKRPVAEVGAPIVRIKGLKKKYFSIERGVVKAVDGVSFEIKEGEVFGLVGISGGGKTTTSRILAGITEPTDGEVEARVGDEWVDMTIPGVYGRGRAKQYIGLLHQEYDLYSHRTVLDNLTDSIGMNLPKELAEIKANYSLKGAGFSEKKGKEIMEKYPDELSVGERHRVALAQVLTREPRLIILDEPTGTMDPVTRRDVANSILSARSEMGTTFLIVSHDMDFVKDVCDRSALMRSGKIVLVDEPAAIMNKLTETEREEVEG